MDCRMLNRRPGGTVMCCIVLQSTLQACCRSAARATLWLEVFVFRLGWVCNSHWEISTNMPQLVVHESADWLDLTLLITGRLKELACARRLCLRRPLPRSEREMRSIPWAIGEANKSQKPLSSSINGSFSCRCTPASTLLSVLMCKY